MEYCKLIFSVFFKRYEGYRKPDLTYNSRRCLALVWSKTQMHLRRCLAAYGLRENKKPEILHLVFNYIEDRLDFGTLILKGP